MECRCSVEPWNLFLLLCTSDVSLLVLLYTAREQRVTNDKFDNDNGMIGEIWNNQKYFDPLEKPQDF